VDKTAVIDRLSVPARPSTWLSDSDPSLCPAADMFPAAAAASALQQQKQVREVCDQPIDSGAVRYCRERSG